MPACEEELLGVALPHQHPNLLGIPREALILVSRIELLEEEALVRLHALILELPQPDLVDDGRRQHGFVVEGGDAVHLLVGVGREVADDLVRGDAVGDGGADGPAREAAGDHAGEAVAQVAKEREHGDLQRGGGVRVDAVVGLENDESLVLTAAAAAAAVGHQRGTVCARGDGGVKARRHTAQRRRAAGEGGCEPRGEILAGVAGVDVDEPKVDQVGQHVTPHLRKRLGVVRAARLEARQHEQEAEHVDAVQPMAARRLLALAVQLVCDVGGLEPLQQQRPHLRVRLLEEEGEACLCDGHTC